MYSGLCRAALAVLRRHRGADRGAPRALHGHREDDAEPVRRPDATAGGDRRPRQRGAGVPQACRCAAASPGRSARRPSIRAIPGFAVVPTLFTGAALAAVRAGARRSATRTSIPRHALDRDRGSDVADRRRDRPVPSSSGTTTTRSASALRTRSKAYGNFAAGMEDPHVHGRSGLGPDRSASWSSRSTTPAAS